MFLKLKKLFSIRLFTGLLVILGCIVLSGCKIDIGDDIRTSSDYVNSIRGCWSCQVYSALFSTAGRITQKVYATARPVALMLLGLGLFCWLIINTASLFLSLRVPNMAKFWLRIIKVVGFAMIVALILANGNTFNEMIASFLQPIIDIFLNFALMIVDQSLPTKIPDNVHSGTHFVPIPGMTAFVGQKLELLIYKVSVAMNSCRVMGLRLLSMGGFMPIIIGLVVSYLFFLLVILFPLFIIDSVLRFTFVMVLLPFFLVCWVFPVTKDYFRKAWNIFLSSLAQLMVCCVFVSLMVSVMNTFFDMRGYSFILSASVQEKNPDALHEMKTLSVTSLSFLFMVFFLYNSAKNVMKIAGFLTGAPGGSVMDKAINCVKEAMKAVAWAALAAAAAAVGAAGVAKEAAKKAAEQAQKAVEAAK